MIILQLLRTDSTHIHIRSTQYEATYDMAESLNGPNWNGAEVGLDMQSANGRFHTRPPELECPYNATANNKRLNK